MSKTSLACMLGLVLTIQAAPGFASIPCEALRPSVPYSLRRADVVVAATAKATSVRKVGGYSRQTIIWQVNENWKGPHFKGSTFTTRTNIVEPIKSGQAYLLYLDGKEPYQVNTCADRSAPLQDALLDVRELYKEFDKVRRNGP